MELPMPLRKMGGKGKGKRGGAKVLNNKTKDSSKKAPSKPQGQWVWLEEPAEKKGKTRNDGGKKSQGNGKGQGKGQGKGKGKGNDKGKKRAPGLTSKIWERKLEEENRKELGDVAYPGVVQTYSFQHGWGFIRAENFAGLPGQVKNKIAESEAAVVAAGKEVKETGLLYFRKPDVNHVEGFKLGRDAQVTFRVYVDEKGAGACDVSMA